MSILLKGLGNVGGGAAAPFDLLPVADATVGAWAIAPLWSKVDDTSDADSISIGSLDISPPCILDLAAWVNPGSISAGTAVVITANEAGGDGTVAIRLLNSGVEVANLGTQALTTSFAPYTLSLTAPQRTALLAVPSAAQLQIEIAQGFTTAITVSVSQLKLTVVP